MRRIFRKTAKYNAPSTKYLLPILMMFSTVISAQKLPNKLHDDLLESGHATNLRNTITGSPEIKVVTYNIRWRSGDELKQIGNWLKNERPAIIALQEVDRARQRSGNANNARTLAEELGMYYAWAAPPLPPPLPKDSQGEEETGVELLSPYPFTNITRLVLPHEGPGGRWRAALGATIKIGKTEVRVYSVHSETRIPVSEKIDQLRAVLDDLARFPRTTPAIVMGDFNSWELPAIDGIRKLFSSSDFTTPFSDNEPTFKRSVVGFDIDLKLDWIWLRGFSAQKFGIDRALTVSDHFPLWANLKFAEDKRSTEMSQ